ncbi:MAG: hypothetical protein DCC75_06855 [Proteobacteria bacterium]|nr:MAG: hypothetical protein DCC75_06855 [Pseudomonadota bacterium]
MLEDLARIGYNREEEWARRQNAELIRRIQSGEVDLSKAEAPKLEDRDPAKDFPQEGPKCRAA